MVLHFVVRQSADSGEGKRRLRRSAGQLPGRMGGEGGGARAVRGRDPELCAVLLFRAVRRARRLRVSSALACACRREKKFKIILKITDSHFQRDFQDCRLVLCRSAFLLTRDERPRCSRKHHALLFRLWRQRHPRRPARCGRTPPR